ncbi:MAG TPA: large conductance mechanosensitive channel protein MscL, partial [Clostridiales bacterium]|nr:large conductance mechanosensitive channel protein MscL [Clostridiales bacterium]
NVMDLAVGIIIGTAFTAIVNSVVNNIIMPIVGIFIGGKRFSGLSIEIPFGDNPVIAYGSFLQAIVNFLIIAACVFFIVKTLNKISKKKPAEKPAPPKPTNEEVLLTEIRDLLKKQQ